MKLCFTNEKAVSTWFERVHKYGPRDQSLMVYSANNRIRSYGYELCSYGDHFPMVRWFPEQKVFLTNCYGRVSCSTSKHQSYVRRHAPSSRIEVGGMIKTDPISEPTKFLDYWSGRARVALDNAHRARKFTQMYIEQAERLLHDRNRFIRTFKLDAPELPEDVTAALVTLKLAA
jgi:hypothetical protein